MSRIFGLATRRLASHHLSANDTAKTINEIAVWAFQPALRYGARYSKLPTLFGVHQYFKVCVEPD